MNESWWEEAFPIPLPQPKPPGASQMLYLVAYDICEPKRLRKIAELCLDYGIRVQYSVFECRLEEDQFQRLWGDLLDFIQETEDRLVAYKLDARAAKEIITAGTMVCSEAVVCYLV